jgi:hypothetical protein
MEALTLEEFKALMKLSFDNGVSVGRKIKPLNEIPLGTHLVNKNLEFEKFFNKITKK